MTIPSWPEGVNYEPAQDPWSQQPWLDPDATEMEGGNVRSRSRPGDDVRILQYVLWEDKDVWESTLEPFLKANRNSRILMPVFLGGSYHTCVVVFSNVRNSYAGGNQIVVSMSVRVLRVLSDLEIAGTPDTTATESETYEFQALASGGVQPYVFTLHSGTLPAGLSLNADTGVISGEPSETGAFAGLVVRVTDDRGQTADLDPFTITVSAAE